MKSFHHVILPLILLYFCFNANAQTGNAINNDQIATPPNAATFTQYSKVPVGEFTGLPDVNVPLYNIKVDNLNIPIYLSYYAKGVQPNVHSGWVGTGWSLIANGVITRKVNGLPDEFCSSYISFNSPYGDHIHYGWYFGANHSQNYAINQYQGGAVTTNNNAGYIYVDTAPDEFDFSFNGLSGAFFMGSDGTWKVRSSGGDTVKVQETMGSVTINPLINPTSEFNQQIINPTFVQFVLTTSDGTRYIFGGGTTGASNTTIDFNRRGPSSDSFNNDITAMAWHISEIDLTSGKKILYTYFRNGTVFTYSPTTSDSYEVYGTVPGTTEGVSGKGSTVDPVDLSMNVMDPVYLQSITFPEGKIVLNSSLSGEVDKISPSVIPNVTLNTILDASNGNATHEPGVVSAWDIYHSYTDILNNNPYWPLQSNGFPGSMWYKLNSIQVTDNNGNNIKNLQLTYTQDSNTRLFLSSIQDGTLPPYTFTYNNIPLPAYCSINTDHWGFYNGPKTMPSFSYDANNFVSTTFQNQYFQFREPDTSYIKAGILTQINYPSGGYSKFFYEINQYSKWVGFPVAVKPTTQTMFGGGLRIKQIISTDNANLSPITYQYNYVNDLVNNVSSGVLGMPKPIYAVNNQTSYANYDGNGNPAPAGSGLDFGYWGNQTIFPSQNDDGNIVTYSNVIERQSGNGSYNGMKVTVFSNHDNGYGNQNPDAIAFSLLSAGYLFHNSDCSFERGKVLSETYYDQNNNMIRQIQNTYNSNSARFNQCTKYIFSATQQEYIGNYTQGPAGGPMYTTFINNSALRFYFYYPYLQQRIETVYPSDHTQSPTTITTTYTYDFTHCARNVISQSVADSKGNTITTNTKYPLDYGTITNPSDAFSSGVYNLQNKFAISLPVETTVQLTNGSGTTQTLSSTLNSYHNVLPVPNLVYQAAINNPAATFTPSSIVGGGYLSLDQSYETRMSIDLFDNLGNVLQKHKINGPLQAYQWSANQNYPEVELMNAPVNGTGSTVINVSNTAPMPNYTQTLTFTTTAIGTITLSAVATYGDVYTLSYTLKGPVTSSGILCGTEAQGKACSNPPGVTIPNAPIGTYTLTSTVATGYASDQGINYIYPITQTTNTTNKFFFDNFEDGDGNSTSGDAKTGHYSHTGTFNPLISSLNNGSYILSYWLKGSNGIWTLQSTTVPVTTNNYQINITGQIDDIRLYPIGSQMTTYTFNPLVGVTSITDAKNEITYYEYDALQRLTNIKDKDGNIVKNITYHYQGQAAPNYSGIFVASITGTAVSIGWGLPSSAATTSSVLQYTDLVTGQVYTYNIPSGQSSTTILVPSQGRSYSFMIIQTLTSGGQIKSAPLTVTVN